MDIDLILESIFNEYKKKLTKDYKLEDKINKRLQLIRDNIEANIRDASEDFIGRPNDDSNREAIRNLINQNLNQYLDTDIRIDSIDDDGGEVVINMSIQYKQSVSGVLPCISNHIVLDNINPTNIIFSNML